MKLHLSIILPLTLFTVCFGQTPSASSTPQSNSPGKTGTLGSSLEKYKDKKRKDSQSNSKNDNSDDGDTIRVKTDLVVNNVLVTDQNGKVITNLTKDDFIVIEDGTSQTIQDFSHGENIEQPPRSIVLILDYEGFMLPYLHQNVQAAKLLVDKLNPSDKMAIVIANTKILTNFTSDKELLKYKLDLIERQPNKVWGYGDKNQFSTLLAVLNEMFTPEDKHRIIISQGDGNEIVTLRPERDAPYKISSFTKERSRIRWEKEKDFGFSDIKEAINRSQTTIYSIIPGIKFLGFSKKEQLARARLDIENGLATYFGKTEDTLRSGQEFQDSHAEWMIAAQTAMSKVAELSGGETAFLEKPEEAENIYSAIFNNINNRYIISYSPTNQEQDGKLRTVKIEVRNHPEYKVWGRQNYYFGNPETK